MIKRNNIINVSIDCMGGDSAPAIIVEAVSLIRSKSVGLHFFLYGKKEEINSFLSQHKNLEGYVTMVDAQAVVLSTDKPSLALRKRKSSMHAAIGAVANGTADCAISAGNTGALMAIARLILGTLPGVNRPAIVATIPAKDNEIVFLDLGANVDCDAGTLYQFALMGKAFAQAVFHKKNPSVALLNIGSEEVKGRETVKGAYSLLKSSQDNINFQGYIEADKMFEGNLDVVVTDGFCGNIMLKTAEGMFNLIKDSIKDSCSSSVFGRMCSILLKYLLKRSLKRFNPKLRNGAMLVGLNGIVIKSHGGADGVSFANAIRVAISAVSNKVNDQIEIHNGNK